MLSMDGTEVTEYAAHTVDGELKIRSSQDESPHYPAARWARDQQALGAGAAAADHRPGGLVRSAFRRLISRLTSRLSPSRASSAAPKIRPVSRACPQVMLASPAGVLHPRRLRLAR